MAADAAAVGHPARPRYGLLCSLSFTRTHESLRRRAMPAMVRESHSAQARHFTVRIQFQTCRVIHLSALPPWPRSLLLLPFQPLRNGFREGVFPLKGRRRSRRSRGNAFLSRRDAAPATRLTVRPTDRPRPGDQRRLGRPLPLYDVRTPARGETVDGARRRRQCRFCRKSGEAKTFCI